MTKRLLGPSRSPVVSATVAKKYKDTKEEHLFNWGAGCLLGAAILGLDMYFHLLSYYADFDIDLVWWAELCVVVMLLVCALYDIALCFTMAFTQARIQITPHQKKLLRVGSTDTGYVTVFSPTPFGSPAPSTPSTPHTYTPPLYYLSPSGSAPASAHSTPQTSPFSTPTGTPGSFRGHRSSVYKASPMSSERITDRHLLESYLRSEEDNEQKLLRGSPDLTGPQAQPYGWYGHQTNSDYTPPLRKYHMATNHSPLSREPDMVWSKLGFKRDELDQWTENCRKWLAQTVVGPVAKEVTSINETLCKIGSPEVQIGSVSLGTLRKVARAKAQHVQTLGMVIPYLELSAKQEYLVQRIKELSQGSYMSAYRWNSGGTWKGRSWDQDLPNDSQIVMHLLCTYLDGHMPPNPRFSNGRTFTSQYFLKCPDKPSAKKADYCIYQAAANPPHYKVLVKELCIDLPKGRSNLFHAVVAFLHHIKTEEKSMLGPVNLELSGINVLWIISNM